MNPHELPHLEVEFDQNTGKIRAVRSRNCADETDETHAAEERIKQLKMRSGRTNKERLRLHKEIDALERMFNLGRYSLVVEVNDTRKEKRLKATGKKLPWLAKKVDNQARSHGRT
jgi:hypothetical protein